MLDLLLSIILSGIFLISVYFFQSIFYPLVIFFSLLLIILIFYPQNDSLVYLVKAKIIAYLKGDFHYLIILFSIIAFFYFRDLIGFNPSLIASFFILAYFLRLDERSSFAVALIFLIFCPFLLIFHLEDLAEKSAILAYYFLVIGVVWEMLTMIREREREKELLTEEPRFVSKHLGLKLPRPKPPFVASLLRRMGGLGIFTSASSKLKSAEAPPRRGEGGLKSEWISQSYKKNISFILNQITNRRPLVVFLASFFITIIFVLKANQLITNMPVSKTTQVVAPSLRPTRLPTAAPNPTKKTLSPTKPLPTATVVPTGTIKKLTLSILNGTTTRGWAASTAAVLKKEGWDNLLNITIADADRKTYDRILLRYLKEHQEIAEKLSLDLVSSSEFSSEQIFYEENQDATPAGDLILILGK